MNRVRKHLLKHGIFNGKYHPGYYDLTCARKSYRRMIIRRRVNALASDDYTTHKMILDIGGETFTINLMFNRGG